MGAKREHRYLTPEEIGRLAHEIANLPRAWSRQDNGPRSLYHHFSSRNQMVAEVLAGDLMISVPATKATGCDCTKQCGCVGPNHQGRCSVGG